MEIVELPINEIGEISDLWHELNLHHAKLSCQFEDNVTSYSFEKCHQRLLENEKLAVFVAKTDAKIIGYCVSSINKGSGEIDSLFLLPEYQGKKIGNELTTQAINWLQSHNCSEINIYVAEGNESVFNFYEKFGFKKRLYVLQAKNS